MDEELENHIIWRKKKEQRHVNLHTHIMHIYIYGFWIKIYECYFGIPIAHRFPHKLQRLFVVYGEMANMLFKYSPNWTNIHKLIHDTHDTRYKLVRHIRWYKIQRCLANCGYGVSSITQLSTRSPSCTSEGSKGLYCASRLGLGLTHLCCPNPR